jgi:hypothetical protein
MNNYRKATHYVCDQVEEKIVDGELKFPDYTFAQAVADGVPGIDWKTDGQFGSYYQVAEPMATMLNKLAYTNHQFFDLCVEICCCNIGSKISLPGALQYFSIEVLKGNFKRPTPRHRPKKKTWLREAFLIHLAKHLEATYGLTKTRNEASPKTSVCDAIAEALTTCGCQTTYAQIKHLLTHRNKARIREEVVADLGIQARYFGVEVPNNWLRPETYQFYQDVANAVVRDISPTFNTHSKKSP